MTTFLAVCIQFFAFSQNTHNLSTTPIRLTELTYRFDEFLDNEVMEEFRRSNTCIGNLSWVSSAWFSFEIEGPCLISFDLVPNFSDHDLDFVLYQNEKVGTKYIERRCMSDGLRLHTMSSLDKKRVGRTGLIRASSFKSNSERTTGYLAPFLAKSSDRFLLLVTNYNAIAGFTIRFSSDVKLAGRDLLHRTLVDDDVPDRL